MSDRLEQEKAQQPSVEPSSADGEEGTKTPKAERPTEKKTREEQAKQRKIEKERRTEKKTKKEQAKQRKIKKERRTEKKTREEQAEEEKIEEQRKRLTGLSKEKLIKVAFTGKIVMEERLFCRKLIAS